jgi:hypothetical protein
MKTNPRIKIRTAILGMIYFFIGLFWVQTFKLVFVPPLLARIGPKSERSLPIAVRPVDSSLFSIYSGVAKKFDAIRLLSNHRTTLMSDISKAGDKIVWMWSGIELDPNPVSSRLHSFLYRQRVSCFSLFQVRKIECGIGASVREGRGRLWSCRRSFRRSNKNPLRISPKGI